MKQKVLSYFLFFSKKKQFTRSALTSKVCSLQCASLLNYFGVYTMLFLFIFNSFTPIFAGNDDKRIFDAKIENKKTSALALTASIKIVGSTSAAISICNSSKVSLKFDILGGSGGTYTVVYSATIGNSQPVNSTVSNYKTGATITFDQPSSTTKYAIVSVTEESTALIATANTAFVTITTFSPAFGTITQPNCQTTTGSIVISSLPITPWTIKSGTQVLVNKTGTPYYTLSLPVGTHNLTISSLTGCSVPFTVIIKAQPTSITTPALNFAQLPCNKTSFVQSWAADADADATGYRIDVATDIDFTNFVPGYENKLLGKVTSETISGINPGGTYYVRLRALADCMTSTNSNISTIFTHTTTYNGTWSDGLPDISKNVIFDNVTYTLPSNIDACTCQVNSNANITVPGNLTLKVENGLSVVGSGKLTFEDKSSLVQVNDTPNIGNITYKRTAEKIRRGDFTYWSTPVNPQRLIDVSPLTLGDKFYAYTGDNWLITNQNTNMVLGKGYIIRGPQSYSITVKADYTASFIGTPNNGIITGETLANDKNYLIGNPYPSALNVEDFLDANPFLSGTLYFWTHNTGVNLIGNYKYTASDYASYNITGGVATSESALTGTPGNNNFRPSGNIGAGQSFFATTMSAGTVTFNNTMRRGGVDNSQFFKSASKKSAIEKHRVWLNMTNTEGAFKQMLVGYVEGATNEYENRYDGTTFNSNPYIDLYSIGNGNQYVIQARALPFTDTDQIPLGYSSTVAGNFTISIDEVDGLFTDQNIYLEDKLNNTYQNLHCGDYNFTTAIGTFNDRFVIHYKNPNIEQYLATPILSNYELSCNQTSYVQEWSAVANATGYKLDVAIDPYFTTFLSGYQNKELGNVLSDTITGIIPGNSYYVRLRASTDCEVGLNSTVLEITPKSTTYDNGVWTNGAPDSTKNIVFNNNYNVESNLNGCSCQINAGVSVIVQSGIVLNLQNALTVEETSTLTFENNASLVQVSELPNSGKIIYKRISSPMKNFDYTYWSSPVEDQILYNLSPNTLGDKYFSFNNNNWVIVNRNSFMLPARGYIIRTPKAGIWPNGEVVSFPYAQPVSFIGIPNNGHKEFITDGAGFLSLVGNPYPSAIDADLFLDANSTTLGGTIQFWTHNTAFSQNAYSSDDYASYNILGGIATSMSGSGGLNPSKPTGKIAAGQSFFVESISSDPVVFENSMRVNGQNSQFFKHAKTASIERHRYWLNLTNIQGTFKQILIGYATGATNNYDNRFDGQTLDGNSFVNFYTLNSELQLSIEGRALPFDNMDFVPLGYKSTIAGAFSITLDEVDGLFTNQNIYLEDKTTATYHNLKDGPYSFTTAIGTFNNRFVIHYTNPLDAAAKKSKVNSGKDSDNELIVSVKNSQININSYNEKIEEVSIYDIKGTLIYEKNNVNTKNLLIDKLVAKKQILIVKTILENGKVNTDKIILQ